MSRRVHDGDAQVGTAVTEVNLCTIVIPTGDRPTMMPQAVDGALSQTVADTEVLVVNDGSVTPVSLPDHPRLRVVRQLRSRGLSAARNLGILPATTC